METKKHPYDPYFNVLTPVLVSKVEEFIVLGYGEVNKHDLWLFLTKKKWKKHKEGIRMYELVSDVLSLNIGEFMNFITVEAFKSPNLLSDLDSEELQELLQPKAE
ncbi:post-transcriptional regulator [Lederbergia citrea]|uniref:Competence protein ComN n=1 Tax=Lederbergia citrea TaxID=2833581 RepID=A0A942UTB4_9BACI|nr:post-transcriptional regulator [Lederbergia citrea]MBS4176223.1 competence protein ComN [Lederbergia citrea]MBS4202783.1 competence protein ComN [Lederbergia citrea]MBS4222549.1 competence protein ComN [Lederbergia citrea]